MTCLILAILALGLVGGLKRWSRVLILAGLLCIPFALFSFEFIPQYWDPNVVGWFGITSLEDLVFSSSTGVIALAIGLLTCRQISCTMPPLGIVIRRYLVVFTLGVGTGYLLKYTLPDPEVMTSTMIGLLLSFAYLVYRRHDVWQMVVFGAAGFSVFYLAIMKLSLAIWPDFINQWQPGIPLGYWWGVPVYELVWAVGFGACWPLYMAYVFDLRCKPYNQAGAGQGSTCSEDQGHRIAVQ